MPNPTQPLEWAQMETGREPLLSSHQQLGQEKETQKRTEKNKGEKRQQVGQNWYLNSTEWFLE